jgi:hypothetical protein
MIGTRLLVLHLASPLAFAAQDGLDPSATAGAPRGAPDGAPAAGSDRLFAYPDESFPSGRLDHADRGKGNPPIALFSALAAENGDRGQKSIDIPAGDYFFCQWTAEHYPDALDGLEAFAEAVEAEIKNRSVSTKGPWMLRVLAEDGGARFQGLKAISA